TSTPTATRTSTSTGTSTGTSTAVRPTFTGTAGPTLTGTPGPATNTATPCTISFSDVHPSDYFYTSVLYLACHGAISGYSDGTFRPYNNTTRGQVTKIVVLGFGIPINTAGGPHFSDVPATHPFYVYVETANKNGIVPGYGGGPFRPLKDATTRQLTKKGEGEAVVVNA